MTEQMFIDIAQDAVTTMLVMIAPILIPALIIGIIIALFQSLTQLQEMTLTFGPKIVVVFVALVLFMPFLVTTIVEFTYRLYDRIVGMGVS